jgi:hypothetical protein
MLHIAWGLSADGGPSAELVFLFTFTDIVLLSRGSISSHLPPPSARISMQPSGFEFPTRRVSYDASQKQTSFVEF